MIGKTLAHYRVDEKIGAGGMGEVYRAHDTRLGRDVALKVLPPKFASDPTLKARFEREARTLSSIAHPHICMLFDVGSEDGVEFLVMELLAGETLAARLVRGSLPVAEALEIGAQVSEALAAAHEAGLIHRDLKPANIMLTPNGAKLLDFGLARASGLERSPESSLVATEQHTSDLTKDGTILGTLRYMAPEQLEAKEVDSRCDVFALGAVLYEMFAGRPAFAGDSQASTIAAILREEPPPLALSVSSTPTALEHTVRRCLAKKPEARWRHAADVAGQLRWILAESAGGVSSASVAAAAATASTEAAPAPAAAPKAQWLAWLPWLLALAAPIVVGLALSGGESADDEAPLLWAQIVPPDSSSLDLIDAVNPSPPVLSPDGRRMLLTTQGARSEQFAQTIWVRDVGSREWISVGRGSVAYPFWSPDGQSIGYFEGSTLVRLDLADLRKLRLAHAPFGKGGLWLADGTIVFARDYKSGLSRIAATGGEVSSFTELDAEAEHVSHRFPRAARRGEVVVYHCEYVGGRELRAVEVDGGRDRALTHADSQGDVVGDRLLYVRDDALWHQRVDWRRLELRGAATPLTEPVAVIGQTARAIFSAAGPALLFRRGGSDRRVQIEHRNSAGERLAILASADEFDGGSLRFSPDGRTIAVTRRVNSNQSALLVIDVASRIQRVLVSGGPMGGLAWGPQSEWVYYVLRQDDGKYKPWRVSTETSAVEPLNLGGEENCYTMEVSPDGRWFFAGLGDQGKVVLYDLERREEPREMDSMEGAWDVSFSPDGHWLVFVRPTEANEVSAFVRSFPALGDPILVYAGQLRTAQWFANGDLFVVDDDRVVRLPVAESQPTRIAFAAPVPLERFPSAQGGDRSPVDETFALAIAVDDPLATKSLELVWNWQRLVRE